MENPKPNPQQPQQHGPHVVHISQVVTETDFLKRSDQLQATLNTGTFVDFCQEKIGAAVNEFEKTLWSFLKVETEKRCQQFSIFFVSESTNSFFVSVNRPILKAMSGASTWNFLGTIRRN